MSNSYKIEKYSSFERTYLFDALRGLGIFFILWGHTDGVSNIIKIYLYSFHVPLFFFISGCLFNQKQEKYVSFIIKNIKRLIIPYFVFAFLTYIPWLLLFRHYDSIYVHPLHPLIGIFYGVGSDKWLFFNTPLWFFPCLFLTNCIYFWINKLNRPLVTFLLLVLCAFVGHLMSNYFNCRLPWSMDITFTALVFFGFGNMVGKRMILKFSRFSVYGLIIIGLLLLIQLSVISINGRVDLNYNFLGNTIYFYIGSFSGILFWMTLLQYLPEGKVLSNIGKETVLIFSLHVMIFKIITGVSVILFNLPMSFRENSNFVSLLYVFIALIFLTPLSKVIRFKLPWLVGSSGK